MKIIGSLLTLSAVVLVVAACSTPSTNSNDLVDSARRITGTVEAWPLGHADLVARIDVSTYALGNPEAFDAASGRLATGRVSALGEVDLTLPAGVDDRLVDTFEGALGGDAGCVSVTPSDARFTPMLVDLIVEQDARAVARLRRAETAQGGEHVIGHIYATQSAQISGSCRISGVDADIRYSLELDLRRGWNVVLATYSESSAGEIEAALHADARPSEVAWQLELGEP